MIMRVNWQPVNGAPWVHIETTLTHAVLQYIQHYRYCHVQLTWAEQGVGSPATLFISLPLLLYFSCGTLSLDPNQSASYQALI